MLNGRQIQGFSGLVCIAVLSWPQLVAAQLANPSAEFASASGTAPAAWTPQVWGDVQGQLTWSDTAADGARSLQVRVTATGATGDARWLSDAVSVSGGATYRLSVRYHATANARLAAMAIGDKGEIQWLHLAHTAPAADWTARSATFVLPVWATQLRVAHLLAEVGSLWTDDFALAKVPALPRLDGTSNVISNPSFETAAAEAPAGAQSWVFTVSGTAEGSGAVIAADDAFAGARFARATLTTAAQASDVKWWTTPIAVKAGEGDWLLSAHTRGEGRVLLGLHLTLTDGQTSWRLLKWTPRGETWSQTTAATTLPANIDTVRVAAIVTGAGQVDLDEVSLIRADAGGDPTGPLLVSFAIDAPAGDVAAARAVLDQRKVLGSFYVPTARLDGPTGPLVTGLRDAQDTGHEIGAYGEDVATWATLTSAEHRAAVIRAYGRFRDLGLGVVGFAPPGDVYDDAVVEAIDSAGGYLRTLHSGTNYPPAAYLNVQVRDVTAATPPKTLLRWANEARRHSAWLVLRYADAGVTSARLGADVDAMRDAGAKVVPVGTALERWQTPVAAAPSAPQPGRDFFGCSAGDTGSTGGLVWLLLFAGGLLMIRRRLA